MNESTSEEIAQLKKRFFEACKNLNRHQIQDCISSLQKLTREFWGDEYDLQDANGNSPLQSIILQSNKGIFARVGYSKAQTIITDTIQFLKSENLLFLDHLNHQNKSLLDLLNTLSSKDGYCPKILGWFKQNQELEEAKTGEQILNPWSNYKF